MVFSVYFTIPSSISLCCADLLSKQSTQYTQVCLGFTRCWLPFQIMFNKVYFISPFSWANLDQILHFPSIFAVPFYLKLMCCNVSTLLELLENIRTKVNNYVQCRQLSIVLVFDSEMPVCFLSTPHFIAFLISKIKRRLKWPTCWWRHSEPLCVLDTLSERLIFWWRFWFSVFFFIVWQPEWILAFRFLLYEVRIPKLFLWRCGRRNFSFSLFFSLAWSLPFFLNLFIISSYF